MAKKKILAVDDDESILRLVQTNLQKVGYEVITACNGREALELVASDRPDLIVIDATMPEMDGYETVTRLKGDEATARIPVIMLTAKSEDTDVFRGWHAGTDVYLTKPVKPTDLIEFVNRFFPE